MTWLSWAPVVLKPLFGLIRNIFRVKIYVYICIYSCFILITTLWGRNSDFPPYYRWGSWGPKRLNDLLQLLNIEAEILKKWILPRSPWSRPFCRMSHTYIPAENIFMMQLKFLLTPLSHTSLPSRNNCPYEFSKSLSLCIFWNVCSLSRLRGTLKNRLQL